MKCIYHNEREAEFICSSCGQPVCRDCITVVNGKNVCNACAYKNNVYNMGQYQHPYKKSDGINGFLFFIFLAVPGLRHMYLGLMKRGFQFLMTFFGSIAFGMLLGSTGEIIFPVFFIIWFYSAFDSYQYRKLIAKGQEVQDRTLFEGYELNDVWNCVSQRKRPVGIIIVSLGIYLLLKEFTRYGWSFHIPQKVMSMMSFILNSIVPIIFIICGVYLITRVGKKQQSNEESPDE